MTSSKLLMKLALVSILTVLSAVASDYELNENSKYKINGHDQLNNVITELADKLFLYNKLSGDQEEIAITSFVDLHQLNKTTHFGRTLSEAFFDELFTRGFNVSDFRGQETLSINANGEYFLTRNIQLLNKDVPSAYIMVGTYSLFEGKVLINARILDNQSGKVLASARSNYLSDDCSILENCKEPRKIRIVTDGCSAVDCPKVSKKQIKIDKSKNMVNYDQSYLIKKQKTIPQTLSKVDLRQETKTKQSNYTFSLIK